MSAREELYAFGMTGKYHSPDKSERMSAHIDAFKAEVLREAAEKIRAWAQPQVGNAYDMADAFGAADLIGPDKEG